MTGDPRPAHICNWLNTDVFYLFTNADKHCRRNRDRRLKLNNQSFYLLDLNLHLLYVDLTIRVRVALHDANQHCEVYNLLHVNHKLAFKHLNLHRSENNVRKELVNAVFLIQGSSYTLLISSSNLWLICTEDFSSSSSSPMGNIVSGRKASQVHDWPGLTVSFFLGQESRDLVQKKKKKLIE